MLRFSPTRMAVITLAMLFAIVTGVAFAFTDGERLFWARDQRELQSLDKTRALGLNSSRDWQLKGGSLVPSATATLDLGSSSLKWRDAFVSRNLYANDDIVVATAGKSFRVKEGGAAARMGTATLSSGVGLVSTTSIGANSRVFVTGQSTSGSVYTRNRVNGTSFAIYSTDNADTGSAAWLIVEPAP